MEIQIVNQVTWATLQDIERIEFDVWLHFDIDLELSATGQTLNVLEVKPVLERGIEAVNYERALSNALYFISQSIKELEKCKQELVLK